MPDDIFIPPPAVAQTKVRWHEVVAQNPMNGMPLLTASAEHVDMDAEGRPVGPRRRAPMHDLAIPYDPANPLHVQAFGMLDQIVKQAHAAREAQAGDHG